MYELRGYILCDLSTAVDRFWHGGYFSSHNSMELMANYYHTESFMQGLALFFKTHSCVPGPQESVLGLLLLIYINDSADKMVTFCRLYADDNSL